MPTSVSGAILLFAIVVAITGAVVLPVAIGAVAVAWEIFLFIQSGRVPDEPPTIGLVRSGEEID